MYGTGVSFLDPVNDKMRVEAGRLLNSEIMVVVRVREAVVLVKERV